MPAPSGPPGDRTDTRPSAPIARHAGPAFWHERSVLVTGATGFLGGWLVRRLNELGARTVCLVRDWTPRSRFFRDRFDLTCDIVWGDVRDQRLLERALGEYEVTTVLHLAAQAIVGIANRNPLSTFESNIAGTWSLLEACRRSPRVEQIVMASSDKAYGEQPTLPYSEAAPLAGRHPYDVSKSCADLIGQAYAATYRLPVAITRCGNFFGGGDLNFNRIVPGTLRAALRGERPVIRSDGRFVRDYFYVEDGVEAYLLLAERLAERPALRGEAFNFSHQRPMTVLELVADILGRCGAEIEPEVLGQADHEIRCQTLSAAKARRVLGWESRFGFEEGMRRTVDWYRAYFRRERSRGAAGDAAANPVHAPVDLQCRPGTDRRPIARSA